MYNFLSITEMHFIFYIYKVVGKVIFQMNVSAFLTTYQYQDHWDITGSL